MATKIPPEKDTIRRRLKLLDLNPMEEARSFASYLNWEVSQLVETRDRDGMEKKIQQFAESLPVGRQTIRNRLALLDLDEDVPCYVREMSLREAKLLALRENLERSDLTPMEEARAFAENLNWQNMNVFIVGKNAMMSNQKTQELTSSEGYPEESEEDIMTQKQLAKTIGVSIRYIQNRLNLLYLPEPIQTMLDNEKIYIKEAEILNQLRKIIPIRKESLEKGLTKKLYRRRALLRLALKTNIY